MSNQAITQQPKAQTGMVYAFTANDRFWLENMTEGQRFKDIRKEIAKLGGKTSIFDSHDALEKKLRELEPATPLLTRNVPVFADIKVVGRVQDTCVYINAMKPGATQYNERLAPYLSREEYKSFVSEMGTIEQGKPLCVYRHLCIVFHCGVLGFLFYNPWTWLLRRPLDENHKEKIDRVVQLMESRGAKVHSTTTDLDECANCMPIVYIDLLRVAMPQQTA